MVGVAEASAPLRGRRDGTVFKYADGSEMNWAWEIPCDRHQWGREVVPMEDVLAVLERGTMRAPGGLVEIEGPAHDELRWRLGL